MTSLPRHVQRYHDAVLKARIVDDMQMRSALGHLERWGGRLANILVELQFAREEDLVRLISETLRMPVLHLATESIHASLAQKFEAELCARDGYVPLSLDKRTLHVAMADPGDVRLVDELQTKHQLRVKVSLAPESEIRDAIDRLFHGGTSRTAVRPMRDGAPRDGAGFIPESQMVETTFELDGSSSTVGAPPEFGKSQLSSRPSTPSPLAPPRDAGSGRFDLSGPSGGPPSGRFDLTAPSEGPPSGALGPSDWATGVAANEVAGGAVDFRAATWRPPAEPQALRPGPAVEASSLSGFLARPPSAGTLLDELLDDPTALDAAARLSPADLARLEKARANQEKSAMILRAVVGLLRERGLLRPGEL